MHSSVRRFLHAALVFLAIGLSMGWWLLVRREWRGRFAAPLETSAHVHLLLVGFVMLMIMGVALWLFPRPAKDDRWYRPVLATAAWWLIVPGTLLRGLTEWGAPPLHGPATRWAITIGATAQLVGLVLFFATMVSRIRAVGSRQREAQGERF
jgi:heme/copper-type cytochrome/quinol oxidase subunit 1